MSAQMTRQLRRVRIICASCRYRARIMCTLCFLWVISPEYQFSFESSKCFHNKCQNRSSILNFKLLSEDSSSATSTIRDHQFSAELLRSCWVFYLPYWIHHFEFQNFERIFVISDLDNPLVPIFVLTK